MFLTVIGSHLYKLLCNLVSPYRPTNLSLVNSTKVIKQHLVPKSTIIAERHEKIQKSCENIGTYLASLKQLAEICKHKGILEEALRDQLVCGLKSEAYKSDYLLKQILEIFQAMEAATKQLNYKDGHPWTQQIIV